MKLIHCFSILSLKRKYSRGNCLRIRNLKNIAPNNAIALWAFVFIFFSLFASSCHLYEYPDDDCAETVKLRLEFVTDFNVWEYEYGASAPVATGEVLSMNLTGEMTYLIHAYYMKNGEPDRSAYETFEVTRDVEGNYDLETAIDLAPGDYRIMVWSDFRVYGRSYYYNADNFAEVAVLTDPYTGNTNYRDAFVGQLDLTVGADTESTVHVVPMERPLARYEFVATGVEGFLKEEKELLNKDVKLSDYYVVVSYPQFMPSEFNMFTNRPSDSVTGIKYITTLQEFGGDMAILGFDFVFVNGADSGVQTKATVYYAEDDREVASTRMLRIPLKRNYNTILKGEFLLKTASGGVGINPDFEGDIDLPGILKPVE